MPLLARSATRGPLSAGGGVATMATFGVRSRSLKRSLAPVIPLNHALSANHSEPTRTAAPSRQAGGHWFEPSTAHLESPRKSGAFVFACRDASAIGWGHDDAGWERE
jgi:hypothetical protein